MSGLLRAEILRLTSRRVVRWLFAGGIVLILVVQGIAFAQSEDRVETVTSSQVELPVELRDALERQCREQHGSNDLLVEKCVRGELAAFGGPREVDHRYNATRLLPDVARAAVVGVMILGFVVGATSVGAEWSAGTMQALLFWEPRRVRVVLAKVAGLVVVLLGFLAVAEVVTIGTTLLNGTLRGTTEGITGGLWASSLLSVARGAGLVAFTGLFGFAIAGFARVTAAALGAAFVYFVILENLVRGFRPGWVRYLVSDNCAAVLTKGVDVPAAHARQTFEGFVSTYRLTGQRAALTLALYLVVLVGAFTVSFMRRDVT